MNILTQKIEFIVQRKYKKGFVTVFIGNDSQSAQDFEDTCRRLNPDRVYRQMARHIIK